MLAGAVYHLEVAAGLCGSTSPGAHGLPWSQFPLDALLLFLPDLAGVTGVSPCSDKHLAFGVGDEELVTGRLMSQPWGSRALFFSPEKPPSLAPAAMAGLFPYAPSQSNSVSLWLE